MKLRELGFNPSATDPCMYVSSKRGERTVITVYVDDLIIASANKKVLKKLKQDLKNSFEMRDLGDLKYCFGIEFTQKEDTITVSQQKYIKEIQDSKL